MPKSLGPLLLALFLTGKLLSHHHIQSISLDQLLELEPKVKLSSFNNYILHMATRTTKAMLPATPKAKEPLFLVEAQLCRRFSLDEIRSATQNFDEAMVVGHGGFGKVYKGFIKKDDGSNTVVVAIKVSNSMSSQGAPEFQAEVEMLSKIRHCNLVSLIGYCYDGKEMALVYE
ncbi:LOW QUALITY PROTEIN: hypothetical protein OSB04_016258 [Centaurea solstitialis]|uniref:Protein kinase domain-containing protein n=1 Tax=Centaurea solstitialis TaxID=347529 RepID=A0AA38T8B6_9ASTR|nr:LOW QUALITY PROTEIN: hypothetical protein OSB04_016258 [Centaurea solstitialis]